MTASTRALAVELASRGVTVNAVAPGFIETDMSEAVRNKAGQLGAWVSDIALFLFGYSAWWLLVIGLRAWLSALALDHR